MNLATLIVAGLLALSPTVLADCYPKMLTVVAGSRVLEAQLQGPTDAIPVTIYLLKNPEGNDDAFVRHGMQLLGSSSAEVGASSITIRFDYYDASIVAHASAEDPRVWHGEWNKRRSATEITRMPLRAEVVSVDETFTVSMSEDVIRSWPARRAQVHFAKESAPAILEIRTNKNELAGTILTTTGDYRHMSGTLIDNSLTLSTFDAGHAVLFKGVINPDGTMSGEFSSGPTYTDTWTGNWDDSATLPDPFSLTTFTGTVEALDALTFPDTGGNPRRVGDFAGKARIIEIWGTWCPNCKDAAPVLAELQERYKDKGLSILGLAFEATGDAERDRKQVALYKQRFNITYPSLIAGVRGKDAAAKAFPMLDQIRAYPSFIFIDGAGKVRGVYTGFTGPAAPEEHDRLERTFDQKVREMLGL